MARQGIGREVKLLFYMEGRLIESGLVSCIVSGPTGQPSTAQLELVPTNTIKHIMPLTWVHVFTTDPWEMNPAGDLSDQNLLFEGVVLTKGFSRQDDARSFSIQCADPSIFWTSAKQFWLDLTSADGSIMDQMAVATSGGYGRFGKLSSNGAFGYMTSRLQFEKDQPEERFMDTLISVLDDIGNVNPFYANARNRFRITDRILRAPAGNTSKLFQLALLGDFIESLAGRQSGQSNLAEIVNQLLSSIMHEWVSVIAPPYLKTRIFDRDVFGNIKKKKTALRRRGPRERTKVDIFEYGPADDKVVASIIFKPHIYTISPPSCNVLFPNMYDTLSYSQDFRGEPTRLAMRPQLPIVGRKATMGLLLQRPVEVEVFQALVRDSRRQTTKQRDPDAKYADGESQTPTYNDYDWTTNEERIRGLVYNFINMAPAPSALTLGKQGEKKANGTRKGGIPDYLQNVASYEFFKSKYVGRPITVSGPYNIRVVTGFPILILDDSEANLNFVGYLDSVSHSVDAKGNALTHYAISYPRIVGDVDYNQPKFTGGITAEGDIDLSLVQDEKGNYSFEKAFDGENQPPVPEWFDETFRNIRDLDVQYADWFGEDIGVVQKILFNPLPDVAEAVLGAARDSYGALLDDDSVLNRATATVAAVMNELGTTGQEFENLLEENENIPLVDAVNELNRRYAIARDAGKEFEEASSFTKRTFTKIDEAFRFIGAAPREFADVVKGAEGDPNAPVTFYNNPAKDRVIDYKRSKLDYFVGDVSAGSGYNAVPSGETRPGDDSDDPLANRMSGAFPIFDTRIHTGTQATDQTVRDALLKDGGEQAKSDWPRYDGRPQMHDFEARLWQQSMRDAGKAPGGVEMLENAESSDYYVEDSRGNVVRPKTPAESAEVAAAWAQVLADRAVRAASKTLFGRQSASKTKTMNTKTQAPTGDGLDQDEKFPLPQPLSEKQVVDLRRAVVEAYRDELSRKRGFVG